MFQLVLRGRRMTGGGKVSVTGGKLNGQSGMPQQGCPAGQILAADGNCILG